MTPTNGYTYLQSEIQNTLPLQIGNLDLSTLFVNLIYLGFVLIVIMLAVVVLPQYAVGAGGSTTAYKNATETFKRLMIGTVLLAAFLLPFYTIYRAFISPNISFPPRTSTGTGVAQSAGDDYSTNSTSGRPDSAPAPSPSAGSPSVSGDAQIFQNMLSNAPYVRSQLKGKINVNKNECQSLGQHSCTSVGSLLPKTLNMLLLLKQDCPVCNITINGGTEWWLHNLNNPNRINYASNNSKHKPVGGAIDLARNSTIDNYITSKGVKTSVGHYSLYSYDFWMEDSVHWHVQPL